MFLFDTAKYFGRFLMKGCHMGAVSDLKAGIGVTIFYLILANFSSLFSMLIFKSLTFSKK